MSEKTLKDYMESIEYELRRLMSNRFNGNIEFKLNFKDGNIANMNVGMHKSIKIGSSNLDN